MDCKKFLLEISSLVDGESEETEELTGHLKTCSKCSEVYHDFVLMSEKMKIGQFADLPSGFDERFFNRLIKIRNKEEGLLKRFLKYKIKVPAPVFVAAAVIIILFSITMKIWRRGFSIEPGVATIRVEKVYSIGKADMIHSSVNIENNE